MRISGVTVLPGIEAPSAARSPFIMRPFDQELVTCQRYFNWVACNALFYATAVGYGCYTPLHFSQTMRAIPTMGAVALDPNVAGGGIAGTGAIGISQVSNSGAALNFASSAIGQCYVLGCRASADARL
jgi:hypothetical protein